MRGAQILRVEDLPLAAISGAWFALGAIIGQAWAGSGLNAGTPVGGTLTRTVEKIGFFTGLGVVIVFPAALALGRLLVVGVRERAIPAGTLPPRRFTQRGRAAPEPEPEAAAEPAGDGSATRWQDRDRRDPELLTRGQPSWQRRGPVPVGAQRRCAGHGDEVMFGIGGQLLHELGGVVAGELPLDRGGCLFVAPLEREQWLLEQMRARHCGRPAASTSAAPSGKAPRPSA